MMNQLDLSIFFTTKAQAQDFSNRLASILDRMFETDFNLENALTEQFGMQKKDKILELFRNNSVNPHQNAQVKEFLSQIISKISGMEVLTLVVAIEVDEEVMKQLSEWCNLNIGRQIVFDLNYNPDLIGGAELYFNGKHLNFSIRDTFEKVLSETLSNKNADLHTPPSAVQNPAINIAQNQQLNIN